MNQRISRAVTITAAMAVLSAAFSLSPVAAAVCDVSHGPAATVLVPYFEVDLAQPFALTTLFSVNNARPDPVLTQVTLWTEWAIPTLAFNVYLTGYDIQTLNLRDLFAFGRLPATGPGESPRGILSTTHEPLPGCNNGETPGEAPVYPDPALSGTELAELRALHTGDPSPIDGKCASAPLEGKEQVARGYVTIDVVGRCSTLTPADPGYFGPDGVALDDNVIWGDFAFVTPREDFAGGDLAVHLRADPEAFSEGDYTFYGRYVGGSAIDGREPLATRYVARHLEGAGATTELLIWRDPLWPGKAKTECGTKPPWSPQNIRKLDFQISGEEGNFWGKPFFGTAVGLDMSKAVQAQSLSRVIEIAGAQTESDISLGAFYLDLNHAANANLFDGVAQGWVGVRIQAGGRFEIGHPALPMDSACSPGGPFPAAGELE